MADEARDDGDGDGGSIAAAGIASHRYDSPREFKPAAETVDGVDIISSMPDEILHHILSFLSPINLAIRTSFLSRRWRHVWCEMRCLNFNYFSYNRNNFEATAREIDQTLKYYRAPKIMSLLISMPYCVYGSEVDRWMEFAMSRNVEKLSLWLMVPETYRCPDSFYLSSSLKQLSVNFELEPGCAVSWKSLRKLTLWCILSDESIGNILSGSPVLETLILHDCSGLERLDLSTSPSLRRLEIDNHRYGRGPTEIVAPHIHYLSLIGADEDPSTFVDASSLVDISSLAEANLGIGVNFRDPSKRYDFLQNAGFLQTMALKMLAKLQNVERLVFGEPLLQILSLAELRGVHFPTLKVQTLTLETWFARSVIPGIARLLQNSPGLKKLIANACELLNIKDEDLDRYLDSQDLNPDQCWRPEYEVFPSSSEFWGMVSFCEYDALSKIVASFMEMVLRNVKTLETLVVGFKHIYWLRDPKWFEELLQMPQTLSNNNNVSIIVRRR